MAKSRKTKDVKEGDENEEADPATRHAPQPKESTDDGKGSGSKSRKTKVNSSVEEVDTKRPTKVSRGEAARASGADAAEKADSSGEGKKQAVKVHVSRFVETEPQKIVAMVSSGARSWHVC